MYSSYQNEMFATTSSEQDLQADNIWRYFQLLRNKKAKCRTCSEIIHNYSSPNDLWKHLTEAHQVSGSNVTGDTVIEVVTAEDTSVKEGKKTSLVWSYFEPLGILKSKCKLCFQVLVHRNNTTRMWRHLRQFHHEIYTSLKNKQAAEEPVTQPVDRSIYCDDEMPNTSEGDASTSKPKKSPVWNYFDLTQGGKAAICKLCVQVVQHHNTTTNLRSHLVHNHPGVLKSAATSDAVITQSVKRKVNKTLWIYFTEVDTDGKTVQCNLCSQVIYRGGDDFANLNWHLAQNHPEVSVKTDRLKTSKNDDLVDNERKSKVWRYFEPSKEGYAQCQKCKSVINYVNTADLWSHLRSTHQEVYLFENPEEDTVEEVENHQKKRSSPLTSKKMIEALIKMPLIDMLPLSVLNDKGMKNLVAILNPTFQMPNIQTVINKWLPQIYAHVSNKIRQKLAETEYVALSTETWISTNNESYLNIFVSFVDNNYVFNSVCLEVKDLTDNLTASSITDSILNVIQNWGLEEKVIGILTDHSEVHIEAVKSVGLPGLICLGKALQFLFEDVINNCGAFEVISKSRAIVQYFLNDLNAIALLYEHQKSVNISEEKLILDSPSRWITTLHMIKKLCQHQESIRVVLASIGYSEIDLTAEEWSIAEELTEVLKPLEIATRELAKSRYVSAAVVLPLCKSLQSTMALKPNDFGGIASIKTSISNSFNTWVPDIENSGYYPLATAIDPRFKIAIFKNDANGALIKQMKEDLITQMNQFAGFQTTEMPDNVDDNSNITELPEPEQDDLLWGDFDNTVKMNSSSSSIREPSGCTLLRNELETFLNSPVADRKQCDPLSWWKDNHSDYPYLSKLIKRYFCVSATSVPSTWMFTEEADQLIERRKKLQDADIMFFLSHNLSSKQPYDFLQDISIEDEY